MGLHSHYLGWPKQRGPERHPEVEFEGCSQEEGGVDRGLGPPGKSFTFSNSSPYLCIPSSEQS